jgi:hypothetical protein
VMNLLSLGLSDLKADYRPPPKAEPRSSSPSTLLAIVKRSTTSS